MGVSTEKASLYLTAIYTSHFYSSDFSAKIEDPAYVSLNDDRILSSLDLFTNINIHYFACYMTFVQKDLQN